MTRPSQAAKSAARASAFALLVPIVGVLSSVALLDEKLGPLTLVGGGVVLLGLWLIEHRGTQPAAPGTQSEVVVRTS